MLWKALKAMFLSISKRKPSKPNIPKMSITVTINMEYTRAGEGSASDVLSAHNPWILEFNDDSIAGAATATVEFVAKDNTGATLYTSDPFPAYLLSGGGGSTAYFRFDASEIIKHIINNYFFKEMANDVISPEDYGSEIEVTIKTYDAAVLEDTENIDYFACHALNQIGDEYGANIARMYYNDTESIAHFLGYPNKLFFFARTTLSGETPIIEILPNEENSITGWTNDAYETFTSSGAEITSAIETVGGGGAISNEFPINAGESVRLIFDLTLNSGTPPNFYLMVDSVPLDYPGVTSADGDNYIVLTSNKTGQCIVVNEVAAASNFSTGEIDAQILIGYSERGTLGLFVHCLDLMPFKLTQLVRKVIVKYDPTDPTAIKTFDLTIFKECENGYYIRFLTKEGYYMHWLFSPYPTRSNANQDIGKIINNFSEMATANSRHQNIGYRESYDKIEVIAAAVPILFRRKLLEIFNSPAVYLWQGDATPDENLITGFVNSSYETFESDGIVISSAIETGSNGRAWSISGTSNYFPVSQGETIIVCFELVLNSGQLPYLRLVDSTDTSVSNAPQAASGFNKIELTATSDNELTRLRIYNTAAANFEMANVVIKRAESETDWILLEKIEGSHELREKKTADNFICTLVLPKRYNQRLGGIDL